MESKKKKKLKACEENCPSAVQPNQNEIMNRLVIAIRTHREMQEAKRLQIIRWLKPVEFIAIQKREKPKRRRRDDSVNLVDEEQ